MPIIYVKLLNEGVDVWRPVEAERLEGETYRIAEPSNKAEDETWEFPPGSLVEVQEHTFSGGNVGRIARMPMREVSGP